MLEIVKYKGFVRMYEDNYFSENIDKSIEYKVPSFDVAKEFSVETVFCENPFGIHKCWNYVYVDNQIETLLSTYPKIRELMALQSTE